MKILEKNKQAVIFGLSSSMHLAEEVSKITQITLGEAPVKRFADGEVFIESKTSVRGKQVFVIQSTDNPANEKLMELLIFVDALRRSSALEINVVMPYFGYSRQDRMNGGRQAITAKLVADMLKVAGASRVITFDLHSPQTQGFFDMPSDDLRAVGILAKRINKEIKEDFVVVSPDHGSARRARQFAELSGNKMMAVIDKRRHSANEAQAQFLLGDVEGQNVVIVDDMVDTAGTVASGVKLLKEKGAKNIYFAATHAVLSETEKAPYKALDKLKEAGVTKFFTTNSIYIESDDFVDVSCLGEAISGMITAHLDHKSITQFFVKKYNTGL